MEKQKKTIFIEGQEIPTYQTIWESNLKRDARIDRLVKAVIILSGSVAIMGICLILTQLH